MNRTINTGSLIFFQHGEGRIRLQRVVSRKKAANGFAIDFASGEMNEALTIIPTLLHHGQGVYKVAVDGIERTSIVVSWRTNRSQVDNLIKTVIMQSNQSQIEKMKMKKGNVRSSQVM